MNNETTDNFRKVIQSFKWPDPEPVSYRLYHDDQGQPLFYTMESLPGTYIEIDQTTYIQASRNVVVREGKLTVLQQPVNITRLSPHADLGTPCDPRDVCVVVDIDRPHQKWQTMCYDIN